MKSNNEEKKEDLREKMGEEPVTKSDMEGALSDDDMESVSGGGDDLHCRYCGGEIEITTYQQSGKTCFLCTSCGRHSDDLLGIWY